MKTIVSQIKIYTFTILLPGLFYSCGKTSAKEPVEENAAPVEVITLKKGSLSSDFRIPGELVAYENVDLYAKVTSFVKKLHVDVGSIVKEGAVLATLEAPEIGSQMAGAESNLKAREAVYLSSKSGYDRLLETSKTPGTVSPNDLDQAYAKQQSDLALFESAKASFREAEDMRNYLEIRAPFSGVISARNVSTGAYVGPAGKGSEFPLFSLADQRRLRLVVSVPEAYTPYIKDQTEAKFSVRSLPGQTFNARVNRLSGVLDSRLRSQRTELDVPNTGKLLLPGMIAEVLLPLKTSESALSVPVESVLNASTGLFVIRVENNKAVWVPVTTGRNDAVNVEITGNVNEGDLIVKNANEEIRNGSELKKILVSTKE